MQALFACPVVFELFKELNEQLGYKRLENTKEELLYNT